MNNFVGSYFKNTWYLVAEMAPYLLFGFAVAGLLHLLIRPSWVKKLLGKPGIGGVVRASLVGVPMPLCSCSVIPVAASFRNSGASRGATASFLSSTPQTGVDSILATYALLGGVFTAVRVGVAFICGIISGFLVDLLTETDASKKLEEAPKSSCCQGDGCDNGDRSETERRKPTFPEAVRYGFITLPTDLAGALIFGLLLAGLITTLLPENLFTGALSGGFWAFALATIVSLPLYVCATGSIPMAYALMAAGLSPGAALVFLIVGPATNTTTVVTVWKMLGRSATVIYLTSLVVVSWLAGWLFNTALKVELFEGGAHDGHGFQPSLWEHLSGVALIALLSGAVFWSRRSQPTLHKAETKSCCHS